MNFNLLQILLFIRFAYLSNILIFLLQINYNVTSNIIRLINGKKITCNNKYTYLKPQNPSFRTPHYFINRFQEPFCLCEIPTPGMVVQKKTQVVLKLLGNCYVRVNLLNLLHCFDRPKFVDKSTKVKIIFNIFNIFNIITL